MPGQHEGEVETLVIKRAARIAGFDRLHTKARHMHRELVDREQRRAGLLADGDGVAGVVLMAMGQRHMGDALGHAAHGEPESSKVGLPVRKGSIRMLDLAVSMRIQEWPNQVICMACPRLRFPEGADLGHKESTVS